MGLISLIKVPGVVGNFVKQTILATYDSVIGNASVDRDEKASEDKEPQINNYKKILQNSKLPVVFKGEEEEKENTYELTENNKLCTN